MIDRHRLVRWISGTRGWEEGAIPHDSLDRGRDGMGWAAIAGGLVGRWREERRVRNWERGGDGDGRWEERMTD